MSNSASFHINTDDGPQEIMVRLDRLIYKPGDWVSVTVDLGRIHLDQNEIGVVLASAQSGDVEALILSRHEKTNKYNTEKPVRVLRLDEGTQAVKLDGILSMNTGETFFAILALDRKHISQDVIKPDIIVDLAYMYDESVKEKAPYRVMHELALTEDEINPPPSGKHIGTIVPQDGIPVQIPIDELVFYPDNDRQLAKFLEETRGKVHRQYSQAPNSNYDEVQTGQIPWSDLDKNTKTPVRTGDAYLVKVSPNLADLKHLPQLRTIFGETECLYGSSEEVLKIYALALQLQLRGYRVGVNPKLMLHDAPRVSESLLLPDFFGGSMFNLSADNRPSTAPILNVLQTWAFTELWDKSNARVNVAFLDQGFAPNADFRTRASGGFFECDLEGGSFIDGIATGFRCGAGTAVGPPTVGASFFGNRVWHGNGVVTTAGGVINNGFGGVGVGGQVIVPMLYRFGLASYAFEIGLGIRKAVVDGASIINISAGYPCTILTNTGIDLDICSPGGRAALCATITAALGAAAVAVCAAAQLLRLLPFGIGDIIADAICGAAVTTVTAAVTACFALLIPGELRGVMSAGVAFALASGVPVVASAGNMFTSDSLPVIVRDIVDTSESNSTLDRWMVIPASIPGVIAVGAADVRTTPPLRNTEFFGNRVDIWAPIPTDYFAPQTTERLDTPVEPQVSQALTRMAPFNGTSAAAPYITGVIALMQAFDPNLDPRSSATTGISPSVRASIPTRIRTILTSTAFTAAQLAARGFPDPSGERRNLVNPFGAVMATAVSVIPNFAALGYDVELNFDEPAGVERATTLTPGEVFTGTILTLPGSGAIPTVPDVDRFRFRTPPEAGLYQATLRLRIPAMRSFGRLTVQGFGFTTEAAIPPSPIEDEFIIRSPILFNNTDALFDITGFGLDDNLYRITFEGLARVADPPRPDRFDRDEPVVNLPESRPNNDTQWRAVPIERIPDVAWRAVGSPLGIRRVIEINDLNFHDPNDVDWFKLEGIPDFVSTVDVDCPANLTIRFSAGAIASLFTADHIAVVRDQLSPISIDSQLLTAFPLFLELRPIFPGVFTEYNLSIEYANTDEHICRLGKIMQEWSQARRPIEDLIRSGVINFPHEFPDLGSIIPEPCLSIPRKMDFAGRIISPDIYAIRWTKDADFSLATNLINGESIRIRLMTASGDVLAQASSLSLRSGRANLSRCEPAYDGELITLTQPNLPKGDYLLAISHGLPNTKINMILPRDIAIDSQITLEDYRNVSKDGY